MSCNVVLSGIVRDCTPSMGGILEVFAINREDVNEVVVGEDVITSITLASSASFKRYSFERNTGSLTSSLNRSEENGTFYYTSDLILSFKRMETAKRVEILALAQNELVLVVKDANGKYWYLGKDEPVMAIAGDATTGTARTDKNGYNITLQDTSLELPFELSAEAIAQVIGA